MMNVKRIASTYRNMPLPAKAGLWFTICGFIQKGISFITTPIFTRLLTTSQYGITSVYYSWYSLLSILCTLNLFYGGFNNGMIDYEERRDQYVSAIQGLITAITATWVLIYLLGRTFWNDILDMSTPLVIIMLLEILAHSALSLWSARERYEFRYRNLVIITIANAFFSSFIAALAVWFCDSEYGAEARIVTHALVGVLICGNIYIYNIRKGKKFFDKKIWKGAFLFNLPLLPHYLSTMVLNQADRIMINRMVGSSEAGIYSVAYSVSMVLNIAVSALNNSFTPWLYGKLKKKDYSDVASVTNLMFIGLALILAMLMAFAPECILIFAGDKYTDAVQIIPAVASSLYFIFMYQIFANVEFYWRKKNFIAYASVFGAVLNI
ncbi:MAG: oligosaccharide flippase family protein, partial [Firmicutes bacterium]|nr:oligosaccharide flippase family protein [Bacillota bacterium]